MVAPDPVLKVVFLQAFIGHHKCPQAFSSKLLQDSSEAERSEKNSQDTWAYKRSSESRLVKMSWQSLQRKGEKTSPWTTNVGAFLHSNSRPLYNCHPQSLWKKKRRQNRTNNSKGLFYFLALKLYTNQVFVSQAWISQQEVQNSET